jgi:hypothetical protein
MFGDLEMAREVCLDYRKKGVFNDERLSTGLYGSLVAFMYVVKSVRVL